MSPAADTIHTLADLDTWSFPGTAMAVIGRPIAHSLSPAMHNAALAELAKSQPRFAGWRYFRFDIAPAQLRHALDLFQQNRFLGLNLTVPHKARVMEHLAGSDAFVRAAGATNTLTNTAAGWRGTNTDGYGIATALWEDLDVEVPGKHIVLLGAGGAARSAAVEFLRARCATLWIGNRTAANLKILSYELAHLTGSSELRCFELARPPPDLPAGAIVINATSLGLASTDPSPIDLRSLPRPKAVYDMVYRPPQTALLRQAAELGLAHANGLSMLVHQGARSLELWTGTAAPVPVMMAAARAALDSA